MALVAVELFAGDVSDGALLLQLSAGGMVKRKCGEAVEAQPSKSASTNQSTTPFSIVACSVVWSVSPATAAAALFCAGGVGGFLALSPGGGAGGSVGEDPGATAGAAGAGGPVEVDAGE